MYGSNSRDRAIQRLKAAVERRGWSRFQMFFFLFIAAATGVFASALGHAAGVNSMAIRYPLCVGIAYVAFLFLLSLYVSQHRSNRKRSGVNPVDGSLLDLANVQPPIPSLGHHAATTNSVPRQSSGGFDVGGVDGEGIVVVLLIVVALGAALLAGGFVLYQAPVIMAEILVDGALFLGLAKRIDRLETRHWLATAIRRTWIPLVLVTVTFMLVGAALESVVPGATTMSQAFHQTHPR
jgi:hypothetical protein